MQIDKLKNRIAELESWLANNHPEHLARPQIVSDLRKAIVQLEILEDNRTFERDTFDIREQNFFSADGKNNKS